MRYPAAWQSEDGSQEGIWYRHFRAPARSPGQSSLTVTLLAGATGGTLDQYAESYLKDGASPSLLDASRQGAAGKGWRFASADGARRRSLLLLQDAGHVWGLYTDAEAAAFERERAMVEEMEKSLTLERPRDYTLYRQERQGFSIRVPPSWRTGQNFATGGTSLLQFFSPPLAAEKRQALQASLTVTTEPAPEDGSLNAYYIAVRRRLGEAHKVLGHLPWRGGYVDMMRIETPLAVSRDKRYFWTAGGRGYSVACEARDDVFPRVTRWCDVIVSTLEIGGQPLPPETAAATPRPGPSPALIAR